MNTVHTDPAVLATRFQALSDETRLRIMEMLGRGERCVCELQEAVGAYQSRLSFHLRKLKDAGLVSDRKEGRWVYYSLNAEAMEEMREYLEGAKPVENGTARGCGDCC
ncbi:MAG TPA: metalloregulator ArsR/SmtB family transcription factor [Longimicrobiaceae bacterium]|nr:metalloregulator ArsR/SmtB family transcription factor [Longimicrobiaceae bacterium]